MFLGENEHEASDYFARLPAGTFLKIMSYIPHDDFHNIRLVNRRFNDISYDVSLWKEVCFSPNQSCNKVKVMFLDVSGSAHKLFPVSFTALHSYCISVENYDGSYWFFFLIQHVKKGLILCFMTLMSCVSEGGFGSSSYHEAVVSIDRPTGSCPPISRCEPERTENNGVPRCPHRR